VIKEALRLHPGVAFPLERIVPEGGATLCGKFIPGGTVVGMNAWVLHRDQRVFGSDADVFRPERWLEAEPDRLKLMEQTFLSVSLLISAQLYAACTSLPRLTTKL
jgi:cytochrome P450